MVILIREFQSPDDEMKKIVLKVVKQCAGTEGVTPAYVRDSILPEFFRNYWVRRSASAFGCCSSTYLTSVRSGSRPTQLQAGRRDDGRARIEGWRL